MSLIVADGTTALWQETAVALKSRGTAVRAPSGATVQLRLDIGAHCFERTLTCVPTRSGLRCAP